MGLLSRYLKAEVPTLNKNNIRLEYIGRQHELPEDVQERMEWAREATARNTGMVLTLALNYSARSELVDAFRSMVQAAAQNGGVDHLHIDEDMVSQHLYTRHLPDPDLVVRTSGEMRLSNFLLGSWLMQRFMSRPLCGLISAACICWKALRSIRSANGGMVGLTMATLTLMSKS